MLNVANNVSSVLATGVAVPANWAPTTAYGLGAFVRPIISNGFRYEVTTAGTSAGTEPVWTPHIGARVVSGTVTFTCRATPVVVTAGQGVRFPLAGFHFTIPIGTPETSSEIFLCISRIGDTLQTRRAREGTTEVAHTAGAVVELRGTAEVIRQLQAAISGFAADFWLTRSTVGFDNNWISVCWSPERGLFVAVAQSGTGNRVMTSPDGIAWTIRTSAFDNNWQSVCWSPERGLFVAVAISGTGNRVMTSPDGITWTVRTSAFDNQWTSVCWSPERGLFVAVAQTGTGTGNRVMTSRSL